jgi:O-antigen biosynthesis protein
LVAQNPNAEVISRKTYKSVQHAGVTFGPDHRIFHQMRTARAEESGPLGELRLLRSVSAVTGACLALRKSLYVELGGLDEHAFAVSLNDVDLCRRAARPAHRFHALRRAAAP